MVLEVIAGMIFFYIIFYGGAGVSGGIGAILGSIVSEDKEYGSRAGMLAGIAVAWIIMFIFALVVVL